MQNKTFSIRNLSVDELQKLAEFALYLRDKIRDVIELNNKLRPLSFEGFGSREDFPQSLFALRDYVEERLDGLCDEDIHIELEKIAVKLARDAYSCRTGRDSFQQDWEEAQFNEPEPLPLPTLKIGKEEIHFEDK